MYKITLALSFFFVALSVAHGQKQFWGTASQGGLYGNGFIFKTDSIGDNLVIVHHFQSAVDGENIGALLYASNNKLYGLAASGGQGAANVFLGGTFFEYDLATDVFRVIQHFGLSNTALGNVYLPKGEGAPGLTEVSPGVIFGLMRQGNYVFSYNVSTGVFSQPFSLPTYQGGQTNSTLQNQLNQALYKAADGLLYATTQTNSSCPIPNPNMGSIIRVNPANNTIAVRHKANCLIDYGYMYNGFFAEANGKLYSTTLYGGANNKGVIFEYDPAANTYTKRHDFNGSVSNYEVTSLVRAKNGKLYGTANGGGIPEPGAGLPLGGGVLFEYDLGTSTFTKKHDFTLTGQSIYDLGVFPSGLINSTNGKLYGATQYGVFEYNPLTEEIRTAGRFVGNGFAPSFVQVCRKPAYTAPATTTYSLCDGAAFTLDLASTNATTVVWKHNNIVDPTRTTPTLSFTTFTLADAGTWVCTLTNACGDTAVPAITLGAGNPSQPIITASGPLTLCAGETITLSAPVGFNGYAWSTGATTREIVVSETGSYTVTVNNGCDSPPSEATTVTVRPLPATPSIIADGPLVFCPGETVTLRAPEGFNSYTWSTGGTTREIVVDESGNYTVTVNDGCESPVSTATVVTVYDAVPSPTSIEALSHDKLKVTGTSDLYEWTLNDVLLDAQTSTIQVTQSGIYKARSLSPQGCLSPDYVSYSFVVTAVEARADNAVVVYPNPSKGILNVSITNSLHGYGKLSVFSATGEVVLEQGVDFTEKQHTIHLENFPPGVYHLMIQEGENIIVKKVVTL